MLLKKLLSMSSHRSVGSTALLPFRDVGIEARAVEGLDVGQHDGFDIGPATIGVVGVEIAGVHVHAQH